MKQEDKNILHKYLPEAAVDMVADAIVRYAIAFRIARQRASKLGDFRAGNKTMRHRISINYNLNQYSFLITFVHELAHLFVYERFGRKVLPHGQEWKQTYRALMQPYFDKNIFPEDLKNVLVKSVQQAKATDGSDLELNRVLKSYNKQQAPVDEVELTKIADGSFFKIAGGRIFQKLHIQRKRYKCVCIASKRLYLFSPVAGVKSVSDEELNRFISSINNHKPKRL